MTTKKTPSATASACSPKLLDDALDAFWEVVARHYPDAKTGDLSPERTIALDQAAENALKEWGGNNVHQAGNCCKTCGSEIVETINDSNFREGECGPCEYQRYKSQPDLLDACHVALDELEQWDKVMGGSEDPRTQEAIDALNEAISNAYGKAA